MQPEHQAETEVNADLKRVLSRYSPVLAAAFEQEDAGAVDDVYVYC